MATPIEKEEFCLEAIKDEIEFLEGNITWDDQEIGFCHNDLQYGNIMIDEETNAITIIVSLVKPNNSFSIKKVFCFFMNFLILQDYEYSSFNPIAYDIANHFCEMAANYHTDTPHVLDYTLYPGPLSL